MTPGTGGSLRVLYVTYDGVLEPLGASQVLPYLRELARRGITFDLLSFEKEEDFADHLRREALRAELDDLGIGWTARRYHRTPTLPATLYDVAAGRRVARRWAKRNPGGIVHARGYLPAMMGLAATSVGARLLFDMRGFWVDERVEGRWWRPDGVEARIGRAVERAALSGADHLVSLTRRAIGRLDTLLPGAGELPVAVIPTCVDVDRFRPAADPLTARRELGLGDGPVLIHAGTITGWYDGARTMEIARAFVERTGGRFVVLTRDVEVATGLADEAGVDALVRTVRPQEVPSWLHAADAGLAVVRNSPSKDASFPTRVGEYLAAGLAVLVTPIGDMPDLAGEVVGILEDDQSPNEAAAWLEEAIRNPGRSDRARAIAEEHLTVEAGARRLEQVYRELAAGTRTSD